MTKTAVLVISFGTSYPETLGKTIAAIENDLGAAFPEADVFRAFTSGMIRRKIEKRDGVHIDSPLEAIQKIKAEGYTDVVCQTTHIINGTEYDLMMADLKPYAEAFDSFTVGRPLLTTHEDYQAVTKILVDALPKMSPVDAWVYMGHGSEHTANSAYPAMNYYFANAGHPECLMGTVEGFPEVEDIVGSLKQTNYKRVGLSPFMIVAGDHAQNDMAGDDKDSWKNILFSAGYDVTCDVRGLGENPAIRAMFVDHAKNGKPIA